jgi:hypothetical protein
MSGTLELLILAAVPRKRPTIFGAFLQASPGKPFPIARSLGGALDHRPEIPPTISVVDVRSRKELRLIKVGDSPWGIAIVPSSNRFKRCSPSTIR